MTVSTPTYFLRDDVHAVAIEADVVFLDIRRDTYACVPAVADRLRVDEAGRVRAIVDPGFASELREAGLLSDQGAPPPPRWPVRPVTASAMAGPFQTPRAGDPLRAAQAMADLARGYWRQPLATLVGWAAEGATERGADAPDGPLLEAVAGFHRWSPYLPAPGKCLLRSFALLRLLRRQGHDARWVFGVRTWPFRAHCWLQRGETVLDDDADALVALTPILVL